MVPSLVNRFKGNVAKYVNQTSELNDSTNRQFSILSLRNARLSSNTMNTVRFQLTTLATAKLKIMPNTEISLSKTEAVALTNKIYKETNESTDSGLDSDLSKQVSATKKSSGCTPRLFNMEDTAQSLSPVKTEPVHEEVHKANTSMLGNRTHDSNDTRSKWDHISKMKAEIKCRACG